MSEKKFVIKMPVSLMNFAGKAPKHKERTVFDDKHKDRIFSKSSFSY